jgi:hypothetical protein
MSQTVPVLEQHDESAPRADSARPAGEETELVQRHGAAWVALALLVFAAGLAAALMSVM